MIMFRPCVASRLGVLHEGLVCAGVLRQGQLGLEAAIVPRYEEQAHEAYDHERDEEAVRHVRPV